MTTRCAADPDVETNLSCGSCGTPICPKCLVHTPVGARCRTCAGMKRLPTYEIGVRQYLKAFGVGLGVSVLLGIAWAWLWGLVSFFNFLVAMGVGYALGEVLSLSVNHRRGRLLQVIGGFCVVVSYLVANVGLSGGALTFFVTFSIWDLLVLALGIVVAVSRLY
ncbi:MAG: hypothetical protein NTU41_08440 [Chloroflexi bacterium]|nr:hypothetical protein [Chloroflexota bacterium]